YFRNTSMTERMKADILSSLKGEISKIIREELKSALAEDFNSLKSELQAVRSEISKNTTAIQTEVDHMKADIQDVKGGLSTWSDEVAAQEVTITSLQRQVTTLTDRCEDMEGRMRRCNIRIAGIQEQPDSSSPNTVAKVIKEVLQLDWDIKIDRSHRTAATRKPGDREKPRVIIAKVHNDGDAAEILRKARERAPLVYNGNRISIFPDYTPSVAKARAAFTDIRPDCCVPLVLIPLFPGDPTLFIRTTSSSSIFLKYPLLPHPYWFHYLVQLSTLHITRYMAHVLAVCLRFPSLYTNSQNMKIEYFTQWTR
uniref:L1 transposable element RRM domain-containing protein n=1 Tax=Cyclopterus lumpus TaxID=8103 RepID=A0A8C2Z916_CYCLU